jgi:hypothetical protein
VRFVELALRQSYILSPAIRTTISSRCHRLVGGGRCRRNHLAIIGPNFSTQLRASPPTKLPVPKSGSTSAYWPRAADSRWYQPTPAINLSHDTPCHANRILAQGSRGTSGRLA